MSNFAHYTKKLNIRSKQLPRDLSITLFGKIVLLYFTNQDNKLGTQGEIFSDGQLCFLPGNRTDALIILHDVVDKYCYKSGRELHDRFIDFQKALDTIPMDSMLNKLLKIGLNGNVYHIIKNMYTSDKARIKVRSKMTGPININQRVR